MGRRLERRRERGASDTEDCIETGASEERANARRQRAAKERSEISKERNVILPLKRASGEGAVSPQGHA